MLLHHPWHHLNSSSKKAAGLRGNQTITSSRNHGYTSITLCPLAQSGCLFVEVLSVPNMRAYLERNNVLVALMHAVRAPSISTELRKAAKAELISELIFANALERFSQVLYRSGWLHLHLVDTFEWDVHPYHI